MTELSFMNLGNLKEHSINPISRKVPGTINKGAQNGLQDADWKHPYDKKPTAFCDSKGFNPAPGSPWGYCCAYNSDHISNPYIAHGKWMSIDDMISLVKDMYNAKFGLYGFVMPSLPDYSRKNGGDGSVIYLASGQDPSLYFNTAYYQKAWSIRLVDAVSTTAPTFSGNDILQKISLDEDPNKYKNTWGELWLCSRAYDPNGQQVKDEEYYKGYCDWEGFSTYYDSNGDSYTDQWYGGFNRIGMFSKRG